MTILKDSIHMRNGIKKTIQEQVATTSKDIQHYSFQLTYGNITDNISVILENKKEKIKIISDMEYFIDFIKNNESNFGVIKDKNFVLSLKEIPEANIPLIIEYEIDILEMINKKTYYNLSVDTLFQELCLLLNFKQKVNPDFLFDVAEVLDTKIAWLSSLFDEGSIKITMPDNFNKNSVEPVKIGTTRTVAKYDVDLKEVVAQLDAYEDYIKTIKEINISNLGFLHTIIQKPEELNLHLISNSNLTYLLSELNRPINKLKIEKEAPDIIKEMVQKIYGKAHAIEYISNLSKNNLNDIPKNNLLSNITTNPCQETSLNDLSYTLEKDSNKKYENQFPMTDEIEKAMITKISEGSSSTLLDSNNQIANTGIWTHTTNHLISQGQPQNTKAILSKGKAGERCLKCECIIGGVSLGQCYCN